MIGQIRTMFQAPEVVVSTWKAAQTEDGELREEEVREALTTLDPLWEELRGGSGNLNRVDKWTFRATSA